MARDRPRSRTKKSRARTSDRATTTRKVGATSPVTRRGLDRGAARNRGSWIIAALVVAVVAVPLIVGLVVMRTPRWYPVLDWAWIELRVRDVGTRHSPLVGLPGRLSALRVIGSHPGPVSFYALAPIYRLLGSSPWALLASTAALNLVAVATAVWIAVRRGGWSLALGVTAVLAVLVHAYGVDRLAVPWNPWLPMLWWFVFLLAAWSVVSGDLPLLPVMVWSGSFCAQTHISYLGMVAGVGIATSVWLAVQMRRRRRDAGLPPEFARWAVWSGGLLVLLWIPVLIDAAINRPSNLSVLWTHFSDPTEQPVGMAHALSAWLAHLDLGTLVTGHQRLDGAPLPGALLLVVWLAAAVASWRWRDRALLALHAVVASALLIGLVSISRILGRLWDYLVLWSWGTTALLVVAVGHTVALGAARRWRDATPAPGRTSYITRAPRVAAIGCGGVALLAAFASTVGATRAEVPHPGLSRTLGDLIPSVVRRLPRDGRYYISWQDSFFEGMTGYSLLLEMERAGLDAGMDPVQSVSARPQGVLPQSEATAVVAFVTGNDVIARLKAEPGAIELAHSEPRPADTRTLSRLRDEVDRALQGKTHAALLKLLHTNVFRLAVNQQLPADVVPTVRQMMNLSVPASVIVIPLR